MGHGDRTVCDAVLRRQVSTRWKKVDEFLEQVHQEGAPNEESYVAILEVCGFHDWLVKRLQVDGRCHDVLVVQPMKRSSRKTDRRDAHSLSELLWINRDRLLRGDRAQGVRRIRCRPWPCNAVHGIRDIRFPPRTRSRILMTKRAILRFDVSVGQAPHVRVSSRSK
jgi:hypothetical protein